MVLFIVWSPCLVLTTIGTVVAFNTIHRQESWSDAAKRVRAAAINARGEILTLRRRLVNAATSNHAHRSPKDLDTYGVTNLGWPPNLFALACSPLGVPTETLADLCKAISDLIGQHARTPELKKMRDLMHVKLSQLKLNLDVEERRLTVLEGLLDSDGGSFSSPSTVELNMPECALQGLSSITDMSRAATEHLKQVEAWCAEAGGCLSVLTQLQDLHLHALSEYVKEQLWGADQLQGAHFLDVQAAWIAMDEAASTLQQVERRLEVLDKRMSSHSALRQHVALDWRDNVTDMPRAAPCASVGLGLSSTLGVLENEFELALGEMHWVKGLPEAPPTDLSESCAFCFLMSTWAELVDIDTFHMAQWHEAIGKRFTAVEKAWEAITTHSGELHSVLREHLPDYRRHVFREIYANAQWGRHDSSGGGSVEISTREITLEVVSVIQRRGIQVVLDLGCGWGEWLPPALCSAVQSNELPRGLHYIGWDIADAPVKGLWKMSRNDWADCGITWEFHTKDAVDVPIPANVGLVVARHVLQHLSHADCRALLQNVGKGRPDFVLLSQTQGGGNRNIEDSSSFHHVSKPHTPNSWNGYDMLKPPFSLPEPLEELSESKAGTSMMLFRGSDMPELDGTSP